MLGTEFSRRLDGVYLRFLNSIQIYILLFDYASIFLGKFARLTV
jgi:hypothetical protein